MVSLNKNTRGGGVFLGDSSINSEFSDAQQLHPSPGNDTLTGFHPLGTILAVSFQLFAAVGIVVCGVIMASAWPKDRAKCEPYFILLYIHSVFWCVSLVVHHHLHLKHQTLRLNGYLDFYKETRSHISIPFHIVSLWNAVILVIATIFHQLYEHFEEQCKATGFLTPVYYMVAIIAVEVVVLFPFIGSYIAKVLSFNKSKPVPDVLRDDWMKSCDVDGLDGTEHLINSENAPDLEELIEKQADLIRYLKDHQEKLSRKILHLSTQIASERVDV